MSRRQYERELGRHHDLSLDMVATANFDGYFTRVNPAFTATLGYTSEELLASPFVDFVHPDDREQTLAEAARQTEAGEPVLYFQNRYRCKDGSYRWLEWMSRPDDENRQLIAVARDITARKQAEEAIVQHQTLLERAVRERTAELQQRSNELDAARLDTLHRLALAAEYRDDETHQHTLRVGHSAALLAQQLGWSHRDVATLRLAAPLHDVGKVAVSDSILLKRGNLTRAEFEYVKRHCVVGSSILAGSSSGVLRLAEEIALTHHERWDGTGYPNRLAGHDIPQSGMIVALADVYDALTHTRPYKEAWPIADSVTEIHRLSGHHFDPALVEAFDQLDPHELAGWSHKHRIETYIAESLGAAA